jgi:hypothetical protein
VARDPGAGFRPRRLNRPYAEVRLFYEADHYWDCDGSGKVRDQLRLRCPALAGGVAAMSSAFLWCARRTQGVFLRRPRAGFPSQKEEPRTEPLAGVILEVPPGFGMHVHQPGRQAGVDVGPDLGTDDTNSLPRGYLGQRGVGHHRPVRLTRHEPEDAPRGGAAIGPRPVPRDDERRHYR